MASTQRKRLEGAMSKLVGAATVKGSTSSHLSTVEINQPSRYLSVNSIRQSPYQPRLQLDPAHIAALAESIRSSTLSNPIIVRLIREDEYELIAGENRLEAIKLLGEPEILAVIRRVDDRTAWLLSVADNLARKDLSDFEQGLTFKKMLDAKLVGSIKELADHLGINRTHVHSCLAFNELPQAVRDLLNSSPSLIGARLALELKEFSLEDHQLPVLQAIELIRDRRLTQSGAIFWIKQKIGKSVSCEKNTVRKNRKIWDTQRGRLELSIKENSSGLSFNLKFDRKKIPLEKIEKAIQMAIEESLST